MLIAIYFCASLSQIWIPEIEYYQKLSSHAQIGAQGAEKQQRKVYVVVGGMEGITETVLILIEGF